MPYSSDLQRRFFHWAEEHGKMKKSIVKDFDQASQGLRLPDKAGVEHKYKGGDVCPVCEGTGKMPNNDKETLAEHLRKKGY